MGWGYPLGKTEPTANAATTRVSEDFGRPQSGRRRVDSVFARAPPPVGFELFCATAAELAQHDRRVRRANGLRHAIAEYQRSSANAGGQRGAGSHQRAAVVFLSRFLFRVRRPDSRLGDEPSILNLEHAHDQLSDILRVKLGRIVRLQVR